MKRYQQAILVIMGSLILSGCHLFDRSEQVAAPIQHEPNKVIELPPKLITTDWKNVLSPLIAELIQTMAVSGNNTLLISDSKNNTDQYISSTTINNILFNAFNQQNIFTVIDSKTVNQTKQLLGLANDDELVSRSKMIALARQVKADYVLFTTINRVASLPDTPADVSMELLLTKTGEIVWQFSSDQMVNDQNVN